MPDLRSILRHAGDPMPPPAVDLATLHVRARRLRRRRALAATAAVALVTAGAALSVQSLLNRSERQVEFAAPGSPSPTPEVATDGPSPSPNSGADATPAAPVTVATNQDGRWRLMVGRQHGGVCAQLLRSDEDFDPNFCGAYEAELDADGVAAAFGGSEGTDAFSYGMVRAEAATVWVELGDDRTITGDTFRSPDFPDLRFFLVQLPRPFAGVNGVTAVDSTGQRVGHTDLRGEDDV